MRKWKTKHIARKKQLKKEQARCIRRLILDQHTAVNHRTRPTPIKYRCRSMKPSGVQAIIQALKRIPSPLLITICIPLLQQGSPLSTFSLLMRRRTIISMNYNFRKFDEARVIKLQSILSFIFYISECFSLLNYSVCFIAQLESKTELLLSSNPVNNCILLQVTHSFHKNIMCVFVIKYQILKMQMFSSFVAQRFVQHTSSRSKQFQLISKGNKFFRYLYLYIQYRSYIESYFICKSRENETSWYTNSTVPI